MTADAVVNKIGLGRGFSAEALEYANRIWTIARTTNAKSTKIRKLLKR